MTNPQKVLLISASEGNGHIRAAQALQAACESRYPSVACRHIDLIDYAGALLRVSLMSSYDFLVQYLPQLYGKIYDLSETEPVGKLLKSTQPLFQWSNSKLMEYITAYAPDRIICTHFLAPYIIDSKLAIPTDMVITDYFAHSIWHAPDIRHFFAPTAEVKDRLAAPGDSVIVSGLPVHLEFTRSKNRAALQQKLSLDPAYPTVLLLSGGTGLVDTSAFIKAILTSSRPLNIVVVTGKKEQAYKKLRALSPGVHASYHVLPFIDNMDEWMRVADIVVTKPGGLTVAECLYLKKPMLLVNPIPGQEEGNADYLLRHNFARRVDDPADIAAAIGAVLDDSPLTIPPDLPDAASIILETALKN